MKLAPVLFLLALAFPACAAPALAEPLVVVPFTNGRFDLASRGWTLGPGATVGDPDVTGENEAFLQGDSDAPRLAAGLAHLASPASTPLSFVLEEGTARGVTYRASVAHAGDAAALAGGDVLPALVWGRASLPTGLQVFDPLDADFPAYPGWSTLSREARAEALVPYVYVGVSLSVAHAAGPRGGLLVDTFGFGAGEWTGYP